MENEMKMLVAATSALIEQTEALEKKLTWQEVNAEIMQGVLTCVAQHAKMTKAELLAAVDWAGQTAIENRAGGEPDVPDSVISQVNEYIKKAQHQGKQND